MYTYTWITLYDSNLSLSMFSVSKSKSMLVKSLSESKLLARLSRIDVLIGTERPSSSRTLLYRDSFSSIPLAKRSDTSASVPLSLVTCSLVLSSSPRCCSDSLCTEHKAVSQFFFSSLWLFIK